MAKPAQAPGRNSNMMPAAHCHRAAAVLLLVASLAGCSTSMLGLGGTSDKNIDSTLVTSTVGPALPAGDSEAQSDALIVRNAVSAADLTALGVSPLAWANTDTGSRGAVHSLIEEKTDAGVVCRKFTTTRERFDGISLYDGRVCMVAPGMWQITSFSPS